MGGGRKNTYCSRWGGVDPSFMDSFPAWQSPDFLPVETSQAGFLDFDNRHSPKNLDYRT